MIQDSRADESPSTRPPCALVQAVGSRVHYLVPARRVKNNSGTLSPSGAAGSRFRPSILQLQSRSVITQTDITYQAQRRSLFRTMQIQCFVRSKTCEAAVNIGLVLHSASQTHGQAPGNIPTLIHKHGQLPSASELPITALVDAAAQAAKPHPESTIAIACLGGPAGTAMDPRCCILSTLIHDRAWRSQKLMYWHGRQKTANRNHAQWQPS